ncbi:MAG: DMT family transporter [Candidatus Woesearchaeota archaeon]
MDKRGYLFVLLTALVSGVSIFLNTFAVKGINPYVFTFSKNVLVVVFLLSLLLLFNEIKSFKLLSKMQWFKLVLIGLVGGSVPFLLFFKGLSMSASSTASLLHKSMFFLVALLAVLFLKEKLNWRFAVAALLLFAGNYLLLESKSFAFGVPEMLILGAVAFWSVETIISKHVLKEVSSRVVAFGRMFFGSLFIFVFLAATGNLQGIASLSVPQFGWIAFTSVLLLAYVTTWYAGLQRVPASIASCILVLGSAVTTVLSFAYSGSFSFAGLAGAALIISGVVLVAGYSYFASKLKFLFPSQN